MRYSEFVFADYDFDAASSILRLQYRFAGGPRFEERLGFDFPARTLSATEEEALDRLFRLVFLMAGVSYYKAFAPPRLVCEAFPLDHDTAAFIERFYEKGLGEFAFANRLSLAGRLRFDAADTAAPAPLTLPSA